MYESIHKFMQYNWLSENFATSDGILIAVLYTFNRLLIDLRD